MAGGWLNWVLPDNLNGMDGVNELVETWLINHRLNLYLLEEVGSDRLAIPLAKGKSVDAQFAHIHNVRLMWLKVSFPKAHSRVTKLEKGDLGMETLKSNLSASGHEVASLITSAVESGGRVKGFKPNATAFVGYLVAHEATHRAQVEIALRQAGVPLSDKVGYGLWEWGVR